MKPIIPLVADGRVFAYACGACMKVRLGGDRIGYPSSTEEKLKRVTETSEWSRERAESCCTCYMCHSDLTIEQLRKWGFEGMTCDPCAKKEAEKRVQIDAACARYQARRKASLEKSLDVASAEKLEDLMSDISEDRFCAGWLVGIEYMLWPPALGDHDPDRKLLLRLSEKSGGWWIWSSNKDEPCDSGEVFVTIDEWLKMYEEYIKKHAKTN